MCAYFDLNLSPGITPGPCFPERLATGSYAIRNKVSNSLGGAPLRIPCSKGMARGLTDKKKVKSSLPHSGSGSSPYMHPLQLPQYADFGISQKSYFVRALHFSSAPGSMASETLGRVINFVSEKSLLCRAVGPAIASGSSGARPVHMGP